jgi:hypothetical protein
VLFLAFPLAVGMSSQEAPWWHRALLVAGNAPLVLGFACIVLLAPVAATDCALIALYVVHGVFALAAAAYALRRLARGRDDP